MNKLVAATVLAAAAFAVQPAAACDWNREASTDQQQVATSTPVQAPQPATPTTTADVSRPVTPTAPVVLVNDRH
jgi:hypothetical protein